MSNGDNGSKFAHEFIEWVQAAYGWDSLDTPIPR